jgi:steroid 5-alpha reductase family enzyme
MLTESAMRFGDAQAALLGLALGLGFMTVVWIGSLLRRDASLVDRFWGAGFVLLAAWYWWSAGVPGSAAGLLVGLVAVWGLRLSVYLTWRNWGHGEDYRYRQMRAANPASFPVRSLVTVFALQGIIMWVVALPLWAAMRGGVGLASPWVWAGAGLWAIGFFFEAVGDYQLARFRADPANRGRVLDAGVWRYTRHPNYFGDACVWWGFFAFAMAAGAWWTVIGPLVMNALLLKVSGVALLEKTLVESKPQYRDYVARTSAFIPRPPRTGPRTALD